MSFVGMLKFNSKPTISNFFISGSGKKNPYCIKDLLNPSRRRTCMSNDATGYKYLVSGKAKKLYQDRQDIFPIENL